MFAILIVIGAVLLVLCLLALCLQTVVRSCTLPRGMAARAACGNCGSEYTGWTTCPICEHEVTEVGVLTPVLALSQRGGVLSAAQALLFIVVLGAVALAGAAFLWSASVGYFEGWRNDRYQAYRGQDSTGSEGLYQVEIISDALTGPSGLISGKVTVVVVPGQIATNFHGDTPQTCHPRAVVEVGSRRVTLYDSAGAVTSSRERFDLDTVEALYAAAGLSTEEEYFRIGMQDLVELVEAALASPEIWISGTPPSFNRTPGRLFDAGGSGSSSSPSVPIHFLGLRGLAALRVLTTGGAAVAYVAGLAWVVRRRRRLLAS